MWDIEVDIACIGSGTGALASAIAAVDAGGQVLVIDPAASAHDDGGSVAVRQRLLAGRGWLLQDTPDVETNEYLDAVIEGVLDPTAAIDEAAHESVTVRNARNLSSDEAYGRTVETFHGSRLNAWAAQCLVSPYGLMYTSMLHWQTTSMRSSSGESIEAHSIGEAPWSEGFGGAELRRWVTSAARERDIEVQTGSSLHHIVFEEGLITGVVLSTPDGPCAVRARAGVTFAPREQDPELDLGAAHAVGSPMQVCLVGRTASRFGRVELLDTVPAKAARPNCTGSRQQFRDGMHESRQPSLEGWRCGKVHGYPAFGQ